MVKRFNRGPIKGCVFREKERIGGRVGVVRHTVQRVSKSTPIPTKMAHDRGSPGWVIMGVLQKMGDGVIGWCFYLRVLISMYIFFIGWVFIQHLAGLLLECVALYEDFLSFSGKGNVFLKELLKHDL